LVAKKVTFVLYEDANTSRKTLAKNLIDLLKIYNLRKNIITYVKNKGFNLNINIIVLKPIVSCNILGLEESYQGTCFGHAFSKAYQYATINVKVCKDFTYVFIKNVQRFVKVYNLAKKYGKG